MENININISSNAFMFDEFKNFVSRHPSFYQFVEKKIVTWKQLYELYIKYGENDEIFGKYYESPNYTFSASVHSTSSHGSSNYSKKPNSQVTSLVEESVQETVSQPVEEIVQETVQPIEPVAETPFVAPSVTPEVAPEVPVQETVSQPVEEIVQETVQPVEPVVESVQETTFGMEILIDPSAMQTFANSFSSSASSFNLTIRNVKTVTGSLSGVWKGSSYSSFCSNCDSAISSLSNVENKITEVGSAITAICDAYVSADETF